MGAWFSLESASAVKDSSPPESESEGSQNTSLSLSAISVELSAKSHGGDGGARVRMPVWVKGTRRGRLDPIRRLLGRKTIRCNIAFTPARSYDHGRSTQENYAAKDAPLGPPGPYVSVRSGLDAAYHGYYTLERSKMQDDLISQALAHGKAQTWPWIVFTAGAMGAGKSRTINWMAERGIFPLQDIVQIDPDLFRTALPEWSGYVSRDALTAGAFTRREAGYLVEVATEAALAQRKHIWVDGSLRDSHWYSKFFKHIRAHYPDYQIAILYVSAEEYVIRERVARRAIETGRQVPEAEIADSILRVPMSVSALKPLCQFVAKIDNSHKEPVLEGFLDRGGTWVCAQPGDWGEITVRFRSVPLHVFNKPGVAESVRSGRNSNNGGITNLTHWLRSQI